MFHLLKNLQERLDKAAADETVFVGAGRSEMARPRVASATLLGAPGIATSNKCIASSNNVSY